MRFNKAFIAFMLLAGCGRNIQDFGPRLDAGSVQADVAVADGDDAPLPELPVPPFWLAISFVAPAGERDVQAVRLEVLWSDGDHPLEPIMTDFIPAAPWRLGTGYDPVLTEFDAPASRVILNVRWQGRLVDQESPTDRSVYMLATDRTPQFAGTLRVRDQYGRAWLGLATDVSAPMAGDGFPLPSGYLLFRPAEECLPPYQPQDGYLCVR